MCRCLNIMSVLLVTVILSAPAVYSEEFTFDYQKIINVDRTVTLDLRLGRGTIEVTGTEASSGRQCRRG